MLLALMINLSRFIYIYSNIYLLPRNTLPPPPALAPQAIYVRVSKALSPGGGGGGGVRLQGVRGQGFSQPSYSLPFYVSWEVMTKYHDLFIKIVNSPTNLISETRIYRPNRYLECAVEVQFKLKLLSQILYTTERGRPHPPREAPPSSYRGPHRRTLGGWVVRPLVRGCLDDIPVITVWSAVTVW